MFKVGISCQIDKEIKNKYQRLYPYTLSRFLINAIKLAIKDKNFFDKVYFNNSEVQ